MGGTTSDFCTSTDRQYIYCTHRWWDVNQDPRYVFPIANGFTSITLYWQETYFNAAGKRMFHVEFNGARWFSNIDVYEKAGNTFYYKSINIWVTTGKLEIKFVRIDGFNNPFISGINIF
jgi:Malectin domain